MNLAAVQQHFRDLAGFVRQAGATQKASDDIAVVATALAPNILSQSLTPEAIEAALAVPNGLSVAGQIGVGAKLKKLTKGPKAAAIKQVVRDRRGQHHRPNY